MNHSNVIQHPTVKKRPPGHDVILMGLIKRGTIVELRLTSGDVEYGRVSQMDKWTITLRDEKTDRPRTFYKHAIESFGEASDE